MTPLEQARSRGPVDERVTVVVPVYNGEAYLAAALESIAAQTVAPAEVIVIDDGSTDATPEIAAAFGARVISQANAGLSAARNAGLRLAATELVALLDGDDVWLPHKLHMQLATLDAYGAPAFIFTDFRLLNDRGVDPRYGMFNHPAFVRVTGGRPTRPYAVIAPQAGRAVLTDNYILPSSVIMPRADALAVGGFDEALRVSEDTEFFLRLFARLPGLALAEWLVLYRRHSAQISSKRVALLSAFFPIRHRMLAAPERYPAADVEYVRGAAYLIHRRIAVFQLRSGDFPAACASFVASLRARLTAAAFAGIIVSLAGRSLPGRSAFFALRAGLRRARSLRRAAGGGA